jgi:predicted nucleic acid-binding protein
VLVVADTGPPHYLVLIGVVDVLPELFGRVLLPEAVGLELRHARTPEPVRRWIDNAPSWVEFATASEVDGLSFPDIGLGECAAIALAVSRRADLVLMDDREGVAAATALGLRVAGTIGVLDRAASRGLIDLRAAVARLRATNFRYRAAVLDALLAQHEASKP